VDRGQLHSIGFHDLPPGEPLGGIERLGQVRAITTSKKRERKIDQGTKIAVALEAVRLSGLPSTARADTRHNGAKLRIAHISVEPHETAVIAERALGRLPLNGQIRLSVG